MADMSIYEGPQAGFIVKPDQVQIISPSTRYIRTIRGTPNREAVQDKTTIFKKHIIGAIPIVPTGFTTMTKKQLASIGIHRAIQAGIDGSVQEGKVFSIVMSGEYAENEDRGDTIVYTGAGGRDKTTGQQTFDQKLEGRNLLLAKCCAAPVDRSGANAGDNWRNGSPIRVVRGSGSAKQVDGSYGPGEGYRYDGIYKVSEYWESTGYTGYKIWRFILRRDDRSPEPWTTTDKARLQVAPRVFHEDDFVRRNDYMITFFSVLALWRVHPGYWEGIVAGNYRKPDMTRDVKDFNEELLIPDNTIFKPRGDLLEAIYDDVTNKRIWRRLFDRMYQKKAGIRDLMSFCEVALTQLEFICLLCKSTPGRFNNTPLLEIPLVHGKSYHCVRCDCNFCKACIDKSSARGIKTCPNCLAPRLFPKDTLSEVFRAMKIQQRR
ncbi:PUA-like domain-containing protein [Phascolomyces articulosus]|uniref:PUA-like domain-containing protein n=1 Tax=Phascolomyces articulosus TaxID=60185 RepID=A0AAD5JZE5_9FUNG|nr:PUA-like domain-containing protein [Phascolomyces articulosus]